MGSFIIGVPIGAIIVAILFGSAMLAMLIARRLPEHHLSPETRSTVSVSVAIVGTMSALVIGLFMSMANSSFTSKVQEVTDISTNTIYLDQLLRHYGPQAQPLRAMLQDYTAAEIEDFFPRASHARANLQDAASIATLAALQDQLLALTPDTSSQQWLKAQALTLTGTLLHARWQLGQEELSRPPMQLLVLVLFWFVVIFASFGLYAPRNVTVIMTIFLSAVSIGSAIRMTTELQRPFSGMVHMSSASLTQALVIIKR